LSTNVLATSVILVLHMSKNLPTDKVDQPQGCMIQCLPCHFAHACNCAHIAHNANDLQGRDHKPLLQQPCLSELPSLSTLYSCRDLGLVHAINPLLDFFQSNQMQHAVRARCCCTTRAHAHDSHCWPSPHSHVIVQLCSADAHVNDLHFNLDASESGLGCVDTCVVVLHESSTCSCRISTLLALGSACGLRDS
jgi:hypothetical protein